MMDWMIILPVLIPFVGAAYLLCGGRRFTKSALRICTFSFVLAAGLMTLALILSDSSEWAAFEIMPKLPLYFRADGVAKLFAGLTASMWLMLTFFSFAYMDHQEKEHRYQMFSLLALGALLGVCFSGNLITTYLFYELMTLATFPIVMHEQTRESISAGMTYLFYSVAGAFLGLVGIFFLYANADEAVRPGGLLGYVAGGFLKADASKEVLLPVVFLMLLGFACKAGMFPLHGWLPKAHPVAPAPASALLSGNITKMGVLFIIRVLYYSVGAEFIAGTWVQTVLLTLAVITVFLGSLLAYREKIFKKRLAYSTVSQVSYCLTGIFLLSETALIGALLHVVFHSVIKNLLFLCAGAVIVRTGRTRIDELSGIGRKMPVTMWCFTIAGLALVGIPPMSAFVSKWYLATGSLSSGQPVFSYLAPVVLLLSALLTAGYLLTVSAEAFFGHDGPKDTTNCEKSMFLLVPLVLLAAACVMFGILPNGLTNFIKECLTGLL